MRFLLCSCKVCGLSSVIRVDWCDSSSVSCDKMGYEFEMYVFLGRDLSKLYATS